jgi:hypothetical protein
MLFLLSKKYQFKAALISKSYFKDAIAPPPWLENGKLPTALLRLEKMRRQNLCYFGIICLPNRRKLTLPVARSLEKEKEDNPGLTPAFHTVHCPQADQGRRNRLEGDIHSSSDRIDWLCKKNRAEGSIFMISGVSLKLKLWFLLLTIFGFALLGIHLAFRPQADIVYSARYYKPGEEPSYYNIWRINSGGSRLVQLTSDSSNDHSPIWLADGKTILFVREKANTRTLCTVDEHGGPVTELSVLPDGYIGMESVAPNRRSLVFLVRDLGWKLILFEIATRQQRDLGTGFTTAWSPDSQRLYVSWWIESKHSAQILNLATGSRLPLTGDLRVAAWLDDNTLVAERFAKGDSEQPRLFIMHADGLVEREVLLPFTWDDENDGLSPFADNLFAIPGNPDRILYGRHAGNSTEGPAQLFYLVSLKGGQPTVVAKGRNLAWSSDNRFFITGHGRHLEPLDPTRKVWVSPLSVVSLADGEIRMLVQGLASIGGFDWKRHSR